MNQQETEAFVQLIKEETQPTLYVMNKNRVPPGTEIAIVESSKFADSETAYRELLKNLVQSRSVAFVDSNLNSEMLDHLRQLSNDLGMKTVIVP